MTDLRKMMARHARTTVTRPDHWGEVVQYKAKGATVFVPVRAVVDRLDLEAANPQVRQVARQRAHVAIPNDATLGVTTVTPGDVIELALRLGAAVVTARVRAIISQDEGMFVVEVES